MTVREIAQENPIELPGKATIAVFICVVFLTLLTVGLQSHYALLIWLFDGTIALFTTLLAAFTGLGILKLFQLGPLSHIQRGLLGTCLGFGFVSLATLGCGVTGWIGDGHRHVLPLILAVCAFIGLSIHLLTPSGATVARVEDDSGKFKWLLLLLVPFAAMVMIVATIPPGFLWQESGFGYDVLEYHLQLPKEYYENGAITYLPHNVYANFPSAAEMLYLFMANVGGESIDFWPLAKALNAILAAATVAAAWFAGREFSARCAIVTTLLMASCGWVLYLSGVAYVENGMMFSGMLSFGCLLKACKEETWSIKFRWIILAGILTGFSCGFKYTAVVMIALPLGIFILAAIGQNRIKAGLTFAVAALLTFSPWLIKNAVFTSNPFFPLAARMFPSTPAGWGQQEAVHFAESHAPAPEDSAIPARFGHIWDKIIAEPPQRFGAIVFALTAICLIRHRNKLEFAIAGMLIVQLLVWTFATHLYSRFAVPILIPLIILGGRGVLNHKGSVNGELLALLIAGIGFNLFSGIHLYGKHIYPNGFSEPRYNVEGATQAFTKGIIDPYKHMERINTALPPDAKILLVGEARAFYYQRRVDYTVVFNHNDFADIVYNASTIEDIIGFLQKREYTHVFVNWNEIHRLRSSRYGFPEGINLVLFEQLEENGLKLLEIFSYGDLNIPYASLYAVP